MLTSCFFFSRVRELFSSSLYPRFTASPRKTTPSTPLLSFYPFLVRGFFLFLGYSPCALYLSPLGAVKALGSPTPFPSPSTRSMPAVRAKLVSLGVLWHQWCSYFSVASHLKLFRVVFLWGGCSSLLYFSHALSWFSWRLSFSAWRQYSSGLYPTSQLGQIPTCLLAFSRQQKTLVPSLRIPQAASLGVGDHAVCWGSWAYIYATATPRGLQLLFLGCLAKTLVQAP
jgi:hypothetical protein